ncbi:helix-turn-helix domain-containing protein [Agathobaculum sp. Marseille-P7918]|uniref:helix-turn-helix domain-containing protein n=1 Tax=Agathobaculum sp. Marseille-P7918 TaxID=2479843 RepID=UPI000F635E3C|nr:XRE family transcriptional regulator [Agathobaculum sp. Marseille-P7918]
MKRIGLGNVDVSLLGARIREARQARGYSAQELAKLLGVTRQAVSRYENGDLSPKSQTIADLSRYLNLPVSFFTMEDYEYKKLGTVFFRSRKTADAKNRDMIRVRNKWAFMVFQECNKYLTMPQEVIPNYDNLIEKGITNECIEEIAMQLRKDWGLGLGPIPNLTLLLETKGFVISGADTEQEKADACSQRIDGRPFVFSVRDKRSTCRTRFSLAHELGHLVLHQDISEEELLSNKELFNSVEKQADRFASCFLLPQESFRREVMSVSLRHLITLKQRWKVSIAAIIYRCSDLGLFTENQVLYLRKQMSAQHMRKVEPLDDEIPAEIPQMLGIAVRKLIEAGIYTKNAFVDRFCLSPKDVEEICSLPKGFFDQTNQKMDNVIHLNFGTI